MSEYRISETDWKRWKDLSATALDRYFEKVLREVAQFAKAKGTPRERYRKLFGYVGDSEELIELAFGDQRRTTAAIQIAAAINHGLITENELNAFSQETREMVGQLRSEA